MRQILFVLLPATALILALSGPIIRLVYQRGEFDSHDSQIVSMALFWFAFSLPTNGVYLLQTRTFFSLQRPWQATGLAVIDLVVSAAAAAVLYKPFGIGGIVAGTGIGTSAAVFAQAYILRRKFGGLELGRLLSTVIRISIACAAMAAVSWLIWHTLNAALGEDTPAQIISLGTGMVVGGVVYLAVARMLRIAELEQITRLLLRRRRA
jgi:putative peptidoglycan lipid II flippase